MSDDILDAFSERPDDDELAFVHYEAMFRAQLDQVVKSLEDDNGRSYDHYTQTYINNVLATVRALELPILQYWVKNPNFANKAQYFRQMQFDIDSIVIEIKICHTQIARKNSIRLEQDTREKVRDLVGKIKTILEAGGLPVERKERMMTILNAFVTEVDRDRTRMAAFAALTIEAAGTIGKAEAKLRPIRKWIDSIANLLREAKSFEDSHPSLPAPTKRVQAPSKQIAPPNGHLWEQSKAPKTGDLDDEIPF